MEVWRVKISGEAERRVDWLELVLTLILSWLQTLAPNV